MTPKPGAPVAPPADRLNEPFRADDRDDDPPGRPTSDAPRLGPTHEVVRRERLNTRLDAIFRTGAGEVTGPAGSGKTTWLRSWSAMTTCADVVWMTIEPPHRDTLVLAQDLADVVRCALREDVPVRSARAAEAVDLIAGTIARSGRRVVIVIDNAELLEGAESVGVVRQLTSLHRDSLRVVVAGRATPEVGLDEMRRRGELLTISADDLRLTHRETAEIVRSVSDVVISDEDLAAIHEQIGGWASGAVLAGLVLRDSDASRLVAGAGIDSHRYFDQFFGSEVFGTLAPDVQTFMLDTCVLGSLEPDLCAELSGRDDAESILRCLERSNVFTEWIGGRPPRFRYHALLRSWLRGHLDRVQPTRGIELSRRAASWCGVRERSADEIDFRLAAGDFAAAAAVIIDHGPRALGEGRYEATRNWIRSLPESLLTANGSLLILLTEAEYRLGNYEATTAARALLRGLLAQRSDTAVLDHLELTVVVHRGAELHVRGQLLAAAAQARRARSMVDLASSPSAVHAVRFEDLVLATNVSSIAAQLMFVGDWAECARLSKWVVDTLPVDALSVVAVRARCLGQLALGELIQGSRLAAEELALEAIALCRFYNLDPLDLGYAELALIVAGREMDRTPLHATLERRAAQLDSPPHTCLAGLLRAWSYVQTGDLASANQVLGVAERTLEALAEPGMLAPLARRVRAIVDIGADEPLLGEREREVLALLAAGGSRRSVADQLHLSLNTIKTHARLAYRALGVATLDNAVQRCNALGIVLVPPTAKRADASTTHQPHPRQRSG